MSEGKKRNHFILQGTLFSIKIVTIIWTFFFLRCRTIILVYFWAPGLHKFIVCFWLLRNFFVFSFSLCYWEKGKSRCFKIVGEEEAIRGGPLVLSRPSAPQEGIAGQTMRVVVGMMQSLLSLGLESLHMTISWIWLDVNSKGVALKS